MLRGILGVCLIWGCLGYNNGYGLKPALGWQTWCAVGPCGTDHCFDTQIRSTADAMVSSGMQALGYEWIVLDDCWHPSRSSNGTLVPYPEFFPHGMKPVVDYVHSKGLKFGLYTSVGDKTCHGGWSPGSYGHYQQDADTFASWDVDYVKVDWCGDHDSPTGHKELSAALNKTGRPMWLELCRGTYQKEDKWGYAPGVANSWRATGDHHDNWESTMSQIGAVKGKSTWSGPYGWAYLDMMMTGGEGCKSYDPNKPEHCPGQTDNQYRTEGSLYAIVATPMMVGTDIRNMTNIMKEVLLNRDLLRINQDYKAIPGDQTTSCGGPAWLRKLSTGEYAVAVPNLSDQTTNVSVCFKDLGWSGETARVRDIWAGKDIGVVTGHYSAMKGAYDTLLVLLSQP